MSRSLVLGTVQLGMDYGVANAAGMPDDDEAAAMLALARESGVEWLDTAQDYGQAERRLGELGAGCDFKIITKVGRAVDHASAGALRESVEASAARLGEIPEAVLIHDPNRITGWNEGLGEAMAELRSAGLTRMIGASVYTPEQFAVVVEAPEVDIIQAPLNVLDHRLETLGLLDLARANGKKIFARSLYLQGLLTLKTEDVPGNMNFAVADLNRFRDVCDWAGIAAREAAFRFILQRYPDISPVVGCETLAQLKDNLAMINGEDMDQATMTALAALPQGEDRLVNPALWPKNQ